AYFIVITLLKLYQFGKIIKHRQAAQIIGNHFEEVKDKLINVLQLEEQRNSYQNNQLILASIEQKSVELSPVPFSNAIQFSENKSTLNGCLFRCYLHLPLASFLQLFLPKALLVYYNTMFT